ncbi:MAG: zinc ABC transporter substrate-binding protein [Actinomycetota bacterium]|nr:zinc ABC transporter substrate-binding protein [Actinomycetota bacterium]
MLRTALALAPMLLGAGAVPAVASTHASKAVEVVAGENEYGDVVAQIGGKYVRVLSVESSPSTDPHTYEATPATAKAVAEARLLVENGLGYDAFLAKLAAASPSRERKVIDVQHLLGLPDSTPNPHLWYSPRTMPAVARAVASDLAAVDPAHARVFRQNEARFLASLVPWTDAIAAFKRAHREVRVATTEPVADYLLAAMGIVNVTPFRFQADVMNGTDPTPQDVTLVEKALSGRTVAAFLYNVQVVDSLTAAMRQTAVAAHVPVVGVYETMPTPGFHYQTWMLAEVRAIADAVVHHASTGRL